MPMRRKFDRDVMNNARALDVSSASLLILNTLQDEQPEVQIMGAAAVFLELAEFLKVPAQDVFTATKNLINDLDGKRVEFRAVRAYLEGELN